MRRDVWHLHSVNVVVPPNHTIEPMLPMHCHKWIAVIIIKKKSGMTVNDLPWQMNNTFIIVIVYSFLLTLLIFSSTAYINLIIASKYFI